MLFRKDVTICLALLMGAVLSVFGADPGRVALSGHVPTVLAHLAPTGRLSATNSLELAIGLPLRNQKELGELIRQLYDPTSSNYHQYLTPPEFTARFGPSEQDYEAVRQFAEKNGLTVVGTHPNRLVIEVIGHVSDIERAFQITLRMYHHPTEARDFFAPDTEPSVPTNLPVLDVEGLSDYAPPKPLAHTVSRSLARPFNFNGSGPGDEYAGPDFRNAYAPGTPLTGAGQTVGLLEFSTYYQLDITNYEKIVGKIIGKTNYIPLTNILVSAHNPSSDGNIEAAVDIEMCIAMAPGLSRVIVYEEDLGEVKNGVTYLPATILSRMASDDLAKQLSCSWGWSGGPTGTVDNALMEMSSQGQSFFQASGDSDAYTGANALDNSNLGDAPMDSTNLVAVGGTSLTMVGAGTTWASETVWNYNTAGIPNEGSGGGISSYYKIPWWQTNVSMMLNQGSTTYRNIPDVALTADNIFACYDDGTDDGSEYIMGTSCAAPLWAAFTALVNQQAAESGHPSVGFLNPAFYTIGTGTNYTTCFHDITTGNNIGTNVPGYYNATNGYDLATGWGTPTGTNLINALAPYPYIVTPPASHTATNGNNVSFTVIPGGEPAFSYDWLFNGTNLPAGGSVTGNLSSTLMLTSVTSANAGSYSVVVTNNYGSVTSSVASLSVVTPPFFTMQPTNLTVPGGGNVVFSAIAAGNTPISYLWQENGFNLSNGGNVSGATSNVLTLTAATVNDIGNYTLIAANLYGAATSNIASLIVTGPPAFTIQLTNQTVQCGSNATFNVAAAGAPPLSYQWSLDGAVIIGITGTNLILTGIHLPDHTITVVVTNVYGSATNTSTLTVVDTLPPAITMLGANPFYLTVGSAFVDPGATADDLCAGSVPVTASGMVNSNTIGTNVVTYNATDGNGNTNSVMRTVIVVPNASSVILASSENPSGYKNNVIFTASVFPTNAMGMIRFLTNGMAFDQEPLVSGMAVSAGISSLPRATNLITAVYSGDADDLPSTNTLTQIVTNHPPVAAPAFYGRLPGYVLDIPVANLATNWTDSDGDTVSLAAVSVSTNGVTLTNDSGTLVYFDTNNVNDEFFCTITDGWGGTSTQTVYISILPPVVASVMLTSSENPSGYRDNVNFILNIFPTNATGTVQFLTNGAAFDVEPLSSGLAVSAGISSLPRVTNLITAVYSGDAADLPATNTLTQIVTNHPPEATQAFYNRLAGYPLDISVTTLATNWSDIDGDSVSLAAVSVSTNGVIVTNNAGTLFYYDTNNVDDEFFCTITDGWGATNVQTVNIAIVLTNTYPGITGVPSVSSSGVTLSFSGAPGLSYVLEATTNVFSPDDWVPLTTNMPGTNGVWEYTDTSATNYPFRYYRLILPR